MINGAAAWGLGGLIPGGAEAAAAWGEAAAARAGRFAGTYRGRVAALDAAELAAALAELEATVTELTRATTYASLRFDADSRPPEHGALLTRLQETGAEVSALTTFFDLEWLTVDDARARELTADPALARYAHHLAELRRSGPYRLSETEEQLLSEKALTGVGAWNRLLGEELAGLAPRIAGEAFELDEALAQMRGPDRAGRAAAERAITACLEPGLALRARILNVLVADHAFDARRRGFSHWLAEFNLDNEVSDAAVEALLQSVTDRSDIIRRWLGLKARVLGVGRLATHDVRAPLGAAPVGIPWVQAGDTVRAVYCGFSDEAGAIVERFLAGGWIDSSPRPGKQTGAFCQATVPDGHPYMLLNYGGTVDDVLTLAHELGHGVHGMLAAPRGMFAMTPTLTLAETASIFGETLTVAHLLQDTGDPGTRLAMLAQHLDAIMAAVFRQVMIHRFERAVHTERRERGELSVARLGELWLSVNRALYGDAVEVGDELGSWWSCVGHIFATPGYVYTYAFGQLLALSLYDRYRRDGDAFVPRFLDILRAGGSVAPDELLRGIGVELRDPGFWQQGLTVIDGLLAQAEAAAAAAALT